MLLPSHGAPITEPAPALELLAGRMQAYVDARRTRPWRLRDRLDRPYRRLSQHLLLNTSSTCCTYVLLSDSGAALMIDFGYDMVTGNGIAGGDRAARRPWLASLPALRRDFGVTRVEVVLATHHHDDHVAGMNLLRDVELTEVWAPGPVADVLEDPDRFDLPCRWHDPVPVDRRLEPGETFRWQEYDITAHDLPGHVRYAAAYEVTVDGLTVLATGDQQQGQGIPGVQHEVLNYQYRNLFRPQDYQASAALYARVRPGLLLSGHWGPRRVDDDLLEMLTRAGDELVGLHDALLPDDPSFGADGIVARIEPYRSRVPGATSVRLRVVVHNPYRDRQRVCVRLKLPHGWPPVADQWLDLEGDETGVLDFVVRAGDRVEVRALVAADVTIGELRLGQHAEALVDVVPASLVRGAGGAYAGDQVSVVEARTVGKVLAERPRAERVRMRDG